MDILKIAVTGSAGSGKSLVRRRLGQIGYATLDCDVIARQVVEPGTPGLEKVTSLFGREVLQEDGTLDRAGLRNLIVNNPEMKKRLEGILHPLILDGVIKEMQDAARAGKKAVAVEVPLLFESGMDPYFDVTIAVTAKDSELVKRIADRDNVSSRNAQKMLNLQMSQAQKADLADHVIENTGTPSELVESVDNLVRLIEKEFLTT